MANHVHNSNPDWWLDLFARLPLPTLALGASYGVYEFNLRYMPWYFAIITATSFEATYLGLSFMRNLPETLKGQARRIAWGTVAVSIVYNTLSGLFFIMPEIMQESFNWPQRWPKVALELGLSVTHGVPLALVAFLVADLLLHTAIELTKKEVQQQAAVLIQSGQPAPQVWNELSTTLGRLNTRLDGLENNLVNLASDIGNLKLDNPPPESYPQITPTVHSGAEPKLCVIHSGAGDGAADGGGDYEGVRINPQSSVRIADLLGDELLAGTELSAMTATAIADNPQSAASNANNPQSATNPQRLSAPEVDWNSLPVEERNEWCYRLRMSGWNYPQIGKLLSKSENTVKGYARTHADRCGLELK